MVAGKSGARRRSIALAFAVALLVPGLLGAPARLSAQDPDREVYTVRSIAVDVTAETAAAAREQAWRTAQRRALARLWRRLSLGGDVSALTDLPDDRIAALVQGFEVAGERTSDVRYLAALTVRFDRVRMRELLMETGTAFAETASQPVLVLPVLVDDGVPILWADPNPWREAWQNLPPQDGLVPLLAPNGDLADLQDIDADAAAAGDAGRLQAIAARYGARDTLVALAARSADAAGAGGVLQITLERHGSTRQSEAVTASIREAGAAPDPFEAGVKRAVAEIENSWKRDNLVRLGRETAIRVLVPIDSFEGWLAVRRGIDRIAVLARRELLRLSRQEALLTLWVRGGEEQLRVALAQRDLELISGAGDILILKPRHMKLPARFTPEPAPSAPAAPAAAPSTG